MKKIFLEELPHRGKFIDWERSINYIIKFIYDDIKGEVKIIDYFKKNNKNYLKIKYNNNIYSISKSSFVNCSLGVILGTKNYKYKYNIGEIITDIYSGKLQILGQIRMKNGKWTQKGCQQPTTKVVGL